jgi:hypothetical protein
MWDLPFPRRAVFVVAGVLVVGGSLAAAQLAGWMPDDHPAPTASSEPVVPLPVASTPPPATFPTRDDAGLPSGWTPLQTHDGDLLIEKDGTVVQDLRITNGTIRVTAKDVTLRRVHAVDTTVANDVNGICGSGLLIERSSFEHTAPSTETDVPVIGNGGFTVRDVMIDGAPEGIRVGSKHCGGVTIERSYIRIVPPEVCGDWHGDGVQGHNGGPVVVRRTTIVLEERADCPGNAPFFYPEGQDNTSMDIDGLLVSGGGYAFRAGTPGAVRHLQVVQDSWGYAPVDVRCEGVSVRQTMVVTVSDGRTTPVEPITPCAED